MHGEAQIQLKPLVSSNSNFQNPEVFVLLYPVRSVVAFSLLSAVINTLPTPHYTGAF